MSIRPVKRLDQVQAHPRRRGRAPAPRVRLRQYVRFRPVPAARRFPQRRSRGLSGRASRGIRTAASRPSPMSSPEPSSTATAWATSGAIAAGDVQWMTAGSGIIHQEMPKGDPEGRMHGFQLWANLPVVAQDDRAALPGSEGRRTFRRSQTTTARTCASSAGTSGARRARWTASPPTRSISTCPSRRAAQDAAGRDHPPRLRLRLRGLRQFCNASGPLAVPTESGRLADTTPPARSRQPLAGPLRPRRRSHGAGRRGRHPLSAGLRQAAGGAGGLVRPHRDEHPGRAPAGGGRAQRRHLYQAPVEMLNVHVRDPNRVRCLLDRPVEAGR